MITRICHVISGLGVGGAEINLYRLLRHLDAGAFASTVVSLLPAGPVGDMIAGLGVRVESLELKPGVPDPRSVMRLSRVLRQWQPDLVQSWMYHADLLATVTAHGLHRLPVVWNVRASNMDMSQYRPLSGWTVRACSLLSGVPQAVIVNSESGRRYHESIGYRPRAWRLIANGVDTEEFRPDPEARAAVRRELDVPDEAVVIGLAARVDPMKDHATFLAAAARLVRDCPQVLLVLAGAGVETDAFRQRVAEAEPRLLSRCRLLGPRRDLPRLMAAWDIGVSSSRTEGLPTAVAEAMACGVPCVVTDVGDSAALAGPTGLVVPPEQPDLLAHACGDLVARGAAARQQLGAAARTRIAEHYSLARTVALYEECYRSVVEQRPRRH